MGGLPNNPKIKKPEGSVKGSGVDASMGSLKNAENNRRKKLSKGRPESGVATKQLMGG